MGAGEEGHEDKNDAPQRQKPSSQPVLFSLYEEEPGRGRPASLAQMLGPEARVQRHTVEHIVDFVCFAPMVQILDALVPQSGNQLVDAFKYFDISVAEQVIEVPKISSPPSPLRAALAVTQMAEQLAELLEIVQVVVAPGLDARGLAAVRTAGSVFLVATYDTGWGGTASPGRYINTGQP